MGRNNMSPECLAEIFLEIQGIVEAECVKKQRAFDALEWETLPAGIDHCRCLFSEVAGMGVKKYVKRRQMTEIYLHLENYDALPYRATVKEIKRYKEKMKKEFGDPLSDLQFPFTPEEIRNKMSETTMGRIYKSYRKDIAQKREKVVLTEGRMKLVNREGAVLYDFDSTYFLMGKRILVFKGEKEIGSVQDLIGTRVFGVPVYVSVTKETSVNDMVKKLHRFYSKKKVDEKDIALFQLEELDKCGFARTNLITEKTSSNRRIKQLKSFNQCISYEDEELYFNYNAIL